MNTIWKHKVTPDTEGIWGIRLPEEHKILHFATQDIKPAIAPLEDMFCWVLQEDTVLVPKGRKFLIVGTGHEIKYSLHRLTFVQTVMFKHHPLVFHVFELDAQESWVR